MKPKEEKAIKSVIGLGAVAVAAYLAYNQLAGGEEESQLIGGSGAFTGLAGGETLTEGGLEEIAGTSDSGISYNINLPKVDTSGIEAFISSPVAASNGDLVKTTSEPAISEPILTKKAATIAQDNSKAETSGSLSSSLAQVFGTPTQKTNVRGDYYTTAAGGGAGAIKGKSLGASFIDAVKKVTSSEGVDTKIYTGASTATQNDLSGDDLKSIFAADKAKKEQMQTEISKTKIGAYKPVSDPLQALKDSGIVKQSYNPNKPTTTKKETSASKSGSQPKKKTISLAEAKKGSSRFKANSL
jgi:hypothetical protein